MLKMVSVAQLPSEAQQIIFREKEYSFISSIMCKLQTDVNSEVGLYQNFYSGRIVY